MTIERVAGSVIGRDHLRARKNGQDAYAARTTSETSVVVVADGCSSGLRSEVGAELGVRWIAALAVRGLSPSAIAEALLARLADTARSLSADGAIEAEVVGDYLLFGYLAVVVRGDRATVFGAGDGLVWIDGDTTRIDPGVDNAPLYPAYGLLEAPIAPRIYAEDIAFDRIAVATDGAEELLEGGTFEALVREDKIFQNPSLLQKRLFVLADGAKTCFDDTTIAVVRRTS